MKQKIVAIVGPTASGKSALAVQLAKQFSGEVISTDSRQIYKGLDLGTGKITKKEMMGVPHHLLDVWSPKKIVTVTEYTEKAKRAIAHIAKKNHPVFICGGTGFYIDALVYEKEFPAVKPNPLLRKKLEKLSTKTLAQKLQKLDPKRAETIDLKNRARLIRALEIIDALGAVPKLKTGMPYEVLFIGLKPDERFLTKKIVNRLTERIQKGMIREAKNLHKKGLSYKRMEGLGLEYKYLALFLQRKISKQEMTSGLELAIKQYSKRQMTWFTKNKNIIWFNPKMKSTPKKAAMLVKKFLKK